MSPKSAPVAKKRRSDSPQTSTSHNPAVSENGNTVTGPPIIPPTSSNKAAGKTTDAERRDVAIVKSDAPRLGPNISVSISKEMDSNAAEKYCKSIISRMQTLETEKERLAFANVVLQDQLNAMTAERNELQRKFTAIKDNLKRSREGRLLALPAAPIPANISNIEALGEMIKLMIQKHVETIFESKS